MADAGENRPNYVQTLEQKHEARKTQRAEKAKDKKSPEQAGEQRVDYLVSQFKKGKEFFQNGIRKAREKAQEFAHKPKEAVVWVAGMPERIRDGVEAAKDSVEEKVIRFAKSAAEKNDRIADGVELRIAKMTGATESLGLGVKVGVTEAVAKYNNLKRRRIENRMENSDKVLRASIEVKRALIAKLQESLQLDESKLTGRVEGYLGKGAELGVKEDELIASAQATRTEAEQRKGNGQGLAGIRQNLENFIRS